MCPRSAVPETTLPCSPRPPTLSLGRARRRAAINLDAPIDMGHYEAVAVREEGGALAAPNRFDLVPTADPLARRWHLQATSAQEASDWVMALEAARRMHAPSSSARCAGDATVLMASSQ